MGWDGMGWEEIGYQRREQLEHGPRGAGEEAKGMLWQPVPKHKLGKKEERRKKKRSNKEIDT